MNEFARPTKLPKKANAFSSRRQRVFSKLLCLLIVFLRLPLMAVENPWFKAFVYFLDPTMYIAGRRQMRNTLLPELHEQTETEVIGLLALGSVVCLSFDLWMSRKTEDVLALEAHFITIDWEWKHVHLGLINCDKGTTGVQIAKQLSPILVKFGISDRVFCYIKDQGSDLHTTAQVLSNGIQGCTVVQCKLFSRKSPFSSDCLAHACNGACNGACLKAKEMSVKVGGGKFHLCIL
jgi:hypothetical protein